MPSETASVLDAIREIQQPFGERDAQLAKIDRIVFRQEAVRIPDEYRPTTLEFRGPLAFFAVSTITAALSVNPQEFLFTSGRQGDAGYMDEALREKWQKASWNRQQKEAGRDLLRPFIWDLVSKGSAVMKTMECRKSAWDSYYKYGRAEKARLKRDMAGADGDAVRRVYNAKTNDYKQRDSLPFPLMSTDVPPESFYYVQGERGFSACVETQKVPYFHALASMGMALDHDGRVVPAAMGLPQADWGSVMSGLQTIDVKTLWDWQKVTYHIEGPGDRSDENGALKVIEHRYGDKYTHTLKGPFFMANGLTTSSRRLEHQGVSLLFAFLDLYPMLDALHTMSGQVAFRYSYPAFIVDPSVYHEGRPPPQVGLVPQGEGQTAEDSDSIMSRPNRLLPYPIKPLELGQMGPEADKFMSVLMTFLHMVLPDVVQGISGGDESGYQYAQKAHFARLAWNPVMANAERVLGYRASYECEMVEKIIGERVYSKGQVPTGRYGKTKPGVLGIGPDEIKGNYEIEVRLKPETPSNLIMEGRQHELLLNNHLESYEDAVEAMGGNPALVERSDFLRAVKAQITPKAVAEVLTRLGIAQQDTMQSAAGLLAQTDQAPDSSAGRTGAVVAPGQGMALIPPPAGQGAEGVTAGGYNPVQPNSGTGPGG